MTPASIMPGRSQPGVRRRTIITSVSAPIAYERRLIPSESAGVAWVPPVSTPGGKKFPSTTMNMAPTSAHGHREGGRCSQVPNTTPPTPTIMATGSSASPETPAAVAIRYPLSRATLRTTYQIHGAGRPIVLPDGCSFITKIIRSPAGRHEGFAGCGSGPGTGGPTTTGRLPGGPGRPQAGCMTTVLITGPTRGLGRAATLDLAGRAGITLILVGRGLT